MTLRNIFLDEIITFIYLLFFGTIFISQILIFIQIVMRILKEIISSLQTNEEAQSLSEAPFDDLSAFPSFCLRFGTLTVWRSNQTSMCLH